MQILDTGLQQDTLVFQVDLFSASGILPGDLLEVEERRKHITYSSRTRLNTDNFLEKLPSLAFGAQHKDRRIGMAAGPR